MTSDGSVLIASENVNADLFWAIRGGGSNFGVVTEFVLKLHAQRHTVYAGRVIFSVHACDKIAAFLDEWWPNARPDAGMLVSLMSTQSGQVSVFVQLGYDDPHLTI